MDRKKLNQDQSGLTLIEGLVAAAIVGIGFIAVFSLSNTSTTVLMSSIDREKGSMLANMIMEDMLTDSSTINNCATTCAYNGLDFKTPNANSSTSVHKAQTKWFERANKLFGAPSVNDKRIISLEEVLDSGGNGTSVFVITIEIDTRDGKSKNIFRSNINAWPSS